MAKRQIVVSDISGKEIPDPKDSATVTITYGDGRRGVVRLDVLASEVEDLAWGRFVRFADPDGNTWSLQELPQRN